MMLQFEVWWDARDGQPMLILHEGPYWPEKGGTHRFLKYLPRQIPPKGPNGESLQEPYGC